MGVTRNHSHFNRHEVKSIESFLHFRYKIEPMEWRFGNKVGVLPVLLT